MLNLCWTYLVLESAGILKYSNPQQDAEGCFQL